MKRDWKYGIGIVVLLILLLILGFDWINVKSYDEDLKFAGLDVDHEMSRNLMIIDALIFVTFASLAYLLYKINQK